MLKRVYWGLGLGLLLVGCGGSLSTTPAISHNYLGTQAPGDVWSWQLEDTTFTATNQTLGLHYSGTKSLLTTGFMKLTITSSDDPNVSAGNSAYALELPGTALVIKPAGDDTKPPIIASCLGSNPAGPQVSFNFVAVGSASFDQNIDEAYGHVTFNVTGNHYDGTSHRWNIGGTQLQDGPSNFIGNNGLMTDQSNGATGAMTPSGVCAIDFGPNAGGVIGVKQPATNVDLADLASRHFKGFLINNGKTQCVDVTTNGDGTLHGRGYSLSGGVETDTSDQGAGVTVSFTSQPNPGEVTVTISGNGWSESMAAAINVVGGKFMMFCFGVGQGSDPYNVVLVEN